MILAELGQTGGMILASAIALITVVVSGIIIVWGHRKFVGAADRAQAQLFSGVQVATAAAPGFVSAVFHVYCGLIVFTRQTEYRFWATPDDARIVLSRMNRFNLTWGFFAYGGLIIPILSLGNYWAQRSRVSKQAEKLQPHEPA